jgi:hypothetical protein
MTFWGRVRGEGRGVERGRSEWRGEGEEGAGLGF